MKSYHLQKIDTDLYVQGLSGSLVYQGLYGVLAAFLLFVALYLGIGTFPAVGICVPAFFAWLYRLRRIQKNPGPRGWNKKQTARKLPGFILIKKRIHQIEFL